MLSSKMAAPMDLCIPGNGDDTVLRSLSVAAELGYGVAAVENYIEEFQTRGKKSKKQGKQVPELPTPQQCLVPEDKLPYVKGRGQKLKQLSRLTMVLSDPSQVLALQSPAVRAYDIVAVVPTDKKMFHHACSYADIDIISLDLTQRLPFDIRKQFISLALEHGLHFEIQYSPAIRDASARRHIISTVHSLNTFLKGKNIIISSHCNKAIELRSPYDLTNLGQLFGLTAAQAKDAVTTNCRAVLQHAASRKTAKCVLSLRKMIPADDGHKNNETDKNSLSSAEEPPHKKLKS